MVWRRALSLGPDLQAGLSKIESLRPKGPVTVLVSGDPGFFSLAKLVLRRFGRENCRIVPGISSVHVAFSRICLDWADAKIISAHVSDPDQAIDQSVAKESKIAVLLGRLGFHEMGDLILEEVSCQTTHICL